MNDDVLQNPFKNTNQPLISVVLPVYNGEKYLTEAIDSILGQTFEDFELIIIDDGSTDGSLEIMHLYESVDSRLKLITRKNRGLPASLNEAINIAKGSLIARMDADDICYPNRLAVQTKFMQQHPEVILLGSAANFIDVDGISICTFTLSSKDSELRKVFPNSPFIHPSVMFIKDIFLKAGEYTERMKLGGEDVTLFERMSRLGKLHNLAEPLIKYRLVPGSMSRKPPAFRTMLTNIIIDEIAGKTLPDQRFEDLQLEAKKIDKSKAIFDYHFEVAKLFIWSGGNRAKSTYHLNKCLATKTSLNKVLLTYLLLLFPKKLIKSTYFRLKNRQYNP